MLTPGEETMLLSAITILKRRRTETEQALASKRAFNEAAWDQYGSELCGGEMMKEEREIRERIASIDADLALLERCRTGAISIEESRALVEELQSIDDGIRWRTERKTAIEKQLADTRRVRHILYLDRESTDDLD